MARKKLATRMTTPSPTGTTDTPYGVISISPRLVRTLACSAALGTYGVVGIASRYTGFDTQDPSRGIEITYAPPGDDLKCHVTVDVHVIMEYGVRVASVTSSLQHQVSYQITRSTGYVVDAVRVHVANLRVTHGG
jgi:uncharacterized alkaline shock family protein YloU